MLQIIFWHISAAGRKTFLIQSGTVARSRHISTAGEMAEKPFLSTPALLPGPGTSPLQKRRQRNLSYPSQHCCQVPTHLHCRRDGRETFLIHPSTVARSQHISTAGEIAEKPFLSILALLPGPGTSPLQERRQRNLSYPSQHCCQVPAHLRCRREGR